MSIIYTVAGMLVPTIYLYVRRMLDQKKLKEANVRISKLKDLNTTLLKANSEWSVLVENMLAEQKKRAEDEAKMGAATGVSDQAISNAMDEYEKNMKERENMMKAHAEKEDD